MVRKYTFPPSSEIKKKPISPEVLKWNADHRKPSSISVPLAPKKVEPVEPIEEGPLLLKEKKVLKHLKIKRKKTLKKRRPYELLVSSVFSKIFSLNGRISEILEQKLLIKSSEDDLLVPLSQISLEKMAEDSNSTLIRKPDGKKRRFIGKTLTIRIKPNNVFCTLRGRTNFRMISGSSTKYKVKMSKKTLRYNYKIVVKSFLEETKTRLDTNFLLVCVAAPKRIRRELLRMLKKKLVPKRRFGSARFKKGSKAETKSRYSSKILMFDFFARKCFNGCRVRKKKRNKQRGLRVYK